MNNPLVYSMETEECNHCIVDLEMYTVTQNYIINDDIYFYMNANHIQQEWIISRF